jgi:hypothetical protein
MNKPCNYCSCVECRCTVDMLKKELDGCVKEALATQVRDFNMVHMFTAIQARYARLLAAATAVTKTDEVYRGTFFNSTQGAKAWDELEKAIKEAEKGQDA